MVRVEPIVDEEFRAEVAATAESVSNQAAILKDMLLIEAALASDKAIIALDEVVRNLFRTATESVGHLRPILWVNPDKPEEEPLEWLREKTKNEKYRQLGYRQAKK